MNRIDRYHGAAQERTLTLELGQHGAAALELELGPRGAGGGGRLIVHTPEGVTGPLVVSQPELRAIAELANQALAWVAQPPQPEPE